MWLKNYFSKILLVTLTNQICFTKVITNKFDLGLRSWAIIDSWILYKLLVRCINYIAICSWLNSMYNTIYYTGADPAILKKGVPNQGNSNNDQMFVNNVLVYTPLNHNEHCQISAPLGRATHSEVKHTYHTTSLHLTHQYMTISHHLHCVMVYTLQNYIYRNH